MEEDPQKTEEEALDEQTSNREALEGKETGNSRPSEIAKHEIKDARAAIKKGNLTPGEIKSNDREGDIMHFLGCSSPGSRSVSSVRAPKSSEFGFGGDHKKGAMGKTTEKVRRRKKKGGKSRRMASMRIHIREK